MEPIEADLVCHPKENKDATREAHDKARHINKRVSLFAKEIAGGDKEGVAEHNRMELDSKILIYWHL